MNTLSIVIAIIVGSFAIVTAVVGATWKLSNKIADLQVAIAVANGKIEGLLIVISSLQAKIIHLESRLDVKTPS